MPDWGSPVSGSALNQLSVGTMTCTPGATAHAKGAWANLGTPVRTGALGLSINWGQDYATHRVTMFDFAVGPAGSETIFLSNLALAYSSVGITASRTHQQEIVIPIALPKGQLIRFRAQSTYASHAAVQCNLSAAYDVPSPMTGSLVDTYGANPAATNGVLLTANAANIVFGPYSEIVPSCNRMECFFIAVFPRTAQNGFSNQANFWELAVGPEGSEVTIAKGQCAGNSSTALSQPQWFGPYFQQIAAGQRLSARVAKQGTTSQRTLDMIVYGVR